MNRPIYFRITGYHQKNIAELLRQFYQFINSISYQFH
jgi:hypothetical protein